MTNARDVILKVLHSYSTKDSFIDWERSDADAILAALNAAGLVVVPEDPTRKMLQAANQHMMDAEGTWRAMVEAAHGE